MCIHQLHLFIYASTREFDVALSFAGEDRSVADELTAVLRKYEVRVFYDVKEQATLWGKYLYQHLQSVYKDKAEYCVVFISQHYGEKVWTKHELKQAQAHNGQMVASYWPKRIKKAQYLLHYE